MTNLFKNREDFVNQNIGRWDVSTVTSMGGMFYRAEKFNNDLNVWDVSRVLSMEKMFQEAELFNSPLNNWVVTRVVNMQAMFRDASSFNQPLHNWDVATVNNFADMFKDATLFAQPGEGNFCAQGWLVNVCFTCEVGQYENVIGSTDCKECPSGTEFVNVTTNCKPCDPGKYRDATTLPTLECQICPRGWYVETSNATKCR